MALNAKVSTGAGPGVGVGGEPTSNNNNTKMLAISYGSHIRLWAIGEDGSKAEIGTFTLGPTVRVEYLFFIGSQLVALSSSGKIGVWHAMTQHWQTQDLEKISSFDTAGSFLLLGCNNGSIYYIGKYEIVGVVNGGRGEGNARTLNEFKRLNRFRNINNIVPFLSVLINLIWKINNQVHTTKSGSR